VKTIGLIGGMSWESTALYYRIINETVKARLGGLNSAKLILYSVNFDEVERLQRAARWDDAGAMMAAAAQSLERAGADLLVLCTNTMHNVAAHIEEAASIPLLHIADATGASIQRSGLRRIGLLGTAFTMEQAFYRDRLATRFALDVLIPAPDERRDVHRIIYDELCRGVIREDSRARYREIIASLVERGAEGIIMGCTEITMLIGDADSKVPLFDTTQLHAVAAVDAALG
jgi:aspartate racemase